MFYLDKESQAYHSYPRRPDPGNHVDHHKIPTNKRWRLNLLQQLRTSLDHWSPPNNSKPWSLLLVESLVLPILLLLICPQNFSRSVRAAECSTLDPPLPQWCLLHGGRFFHRHGHGSERISGEFAVPGLGSNIENPGFFASEKKHQITGPIETKTVQKTFSIVPCPLIIIIGSRWSLHPHTFWFTHFSIRLGLDSSDWMVMPLVNRTGPSPQHKHSCGMLWNDHVHQN